MFKFEELNIISVRKKNMLDQIMREGHSDLLETCDGHTLSVRDCTSTSFLLQSKGNLHAFSLCLLDTASIGAKRFPSNEKYLALHPYIV